MVNTALERELREHLSALAPDQQRLVVDYARALRETPRRGVPGHTLLRFAGAIPLEEADAMGRAIEDGCESVDPDGW